jgi:3-hydroxyisobutyrate dehydrogenase-like beta-hydroxyacid dehydrogenase
MNVTAIGDEIGTASSVKMVRSVFMKGFTAILLESLYAARKLNAEDAVLDSLQVTFPGMNWKELADYYGPRLIRHAKRQSEEMLSVVETLEELGVEPITVLASAKRLGWLGNMELNRELNELPNNYREFLDILIEWDRS